MRERKLVQRTEVCETTVAIIDYDHDSGVMIMRVIYQTWVCRFSFLSKKHSYENDYKRVVSKLVQERIARQ